MLNLREVLLRLKDSLSNKLLRVAMKAVPEEKLLGLIVDVVPLSNEWKQQILDILHAMAEAEGCRIIDLVFSASFIDLLDNAIALTHVDFPSVVYEGKELFKTFGGVNNAFNQER